MLQQNGGLFTCNTTRPLPLRMRPDLTSHQHTYLGRKYWVIKDPLTLKYYRFEEEEFYILQLLDGQNSLKAIQEAFQQKYRPQKISIRELHQLVGMLYRSSLVLSDAAGQGKQLIERERTSQRRQRLASLTNILSIRFKGWDPDRLLDRLNVVFGWCFSIPAFCLLLILECWSGAVDRIPNGYVSRQTARLSRILRSQELALDGSHSLRYQDPSRTGARAVMQAFRRRVP